MVINRVIDCNSIKWEFLSKPRKKVKVGSIITFANQLVGVVIEKSNDNGLDVIEFFIDKNRDKEQYISYSQENFRLKSISELEFFNLLNEIGEMPLPPYMKRTPVKDDERNYQTVFSEITGSVAAPTAGLHFSQELLDKIKSKGVKILYVTLHIGGGTFLPIRVDNIAHHKMHSEFYSIDGATCDIINRAKLDRHRVIAVGTTVIRVLESAAEFCDNDILYPHSRYTNIFINGNFNFKVVDCLITNFHLPKSTLFILICAFLGSIDNGQNLYKYAIDNQYRFFSYGDGCFLIR
jgi:S-adenosylmethionine:tRNA ribosyltransferase-isomerase